MLWVLALAVLQDTPEAFFERVTFGKAETAGDAGERVVAVLKSKETWLAAHRAVEARLGPFREKLTVKVTFDYEGDEAAKAASNGATGAIRFNLSLLEEQQRKADVLQARAAELAKEGKRLVFKVPPARLDRVLWHELTHLHHGTLDAPLWFSEGLATWVSDDPNSLKAFALSGRELRRLDDDVQEPVDVYARGHLFWMWIESKGCRRQLTDAVVGRREPWKASLVKAVGLKWDDLLETEWEWSGKELAKHR